MGKTFWNRIKDAWKVLWETSEVQVITKDMKTFALIEEKTNQFERNVIVKRLDRLERTLNQNMMKTSEIAEYLKATQEVLVAFSTSAEEISHGFEMLADSITNTPPPVETKKVIPKSSIVDQFAQYSASNHDGRKKSN